ncbi:WhiB family transcriptional regulator [Streptomyces sp. NBC_00378]|uniref:WhiB family transcriptional regulator n=1 Tax=unclassified Streptomyces TaxID=2593676 RepID=UPI002251FFEC|nr:MULTISPECIES: WhiB family transcriptional regulator [unclassified Streptomyces]MCX5112182.1 WhiB family transcriptional regulator [Streptomyces sp. NBC_00378]MCX5114623.1 WhiB family transcriptional regulator [Streptomyces sp. NBC_00378]
MNYAPNTLPWPEAWADHAACRGHADVFLPPRTETDAAPGLARQICESCPVRRACLVTAMEEEGSADQYRRAGVRGGLTPVERAHLARRMRKKAAEEAGPACGTTKAYYRHLQAGEPVDDACQAASDAYEQQLAASQNGKR